MRNSPPPINQRTALIMSSSQPYIPSPQVSNRDAYACSFSPTSLSTHAQRCWDQKEPTSKRLAPPPTSMTATKSSDMVGGSAADDTFCGRKHGYSTTTLYRCWAVGTIVAARAGHISKMISHMRHNEPPGDFPSQARRRLPHYLPHRCGARYWHVPCPLSGDRH